MSKRMVKELATFALPSQPGNERQALALVAAAVSESGLSPDQVERLKTAVAEATMNAIEHGNRDRSDLLVEVTVFEEPGAVVVSISDRGAVTSIHRTPVEPDLDEKLSGLQTPRGWGLFLIRHMVDAVDEVSDGDRHTVRLTVHPGVPPAYPRSHR
ncbi:MAG TPA: ATP-binding protein [Candidatus Dormibacteraeota bacterium]|nr:ATP-binding protein [Candidatus Dormibacteraeota bacterium]